MNLVEIDEIIKSDPFCIPVPKNSNGKEYVIRIGNMCRKFTL